MQKVIINVPDGYEVQIVKKEDKKESVIRTYQDLIDNNIKIKGFCVGSGKVHPMHNPLTSDSTIRDLAASEKVAKSMLAMAMISQLMPYYGGEITDEEWENISIMKYSFLTRNNKIIGFITAADKCFLAFHTLQQRDEFLKYNEQLVKDYLMID